VNGSSSTSAVVPSRSFSVVGFYDPSSHGQDTDMTCAMTRRDLLEAGLGAVAAMLAAPVAPARASGSGS
jgi:hypothetical protein